MEFLYKEFSWKDDNLKLYSLFKDYKNCFFLDSSASCDKSGRFSFIGFNPFYVYNSKNENSFYKLRSLLKNYQIKNNRYLPFLGGAVGYFAYDLAQILERKINLKAKDDLGLPDFHFSFYSTIVTIDHLKNKLIIISTGFPEKKNYLRKLNAKKNLDFIINILKKHNVPKNQQADDTAFDLKSNFTKENYLKAIEKSLKFIAKGDIYQVNLSQRFTAKTKQDSFNLFKNLRRLSPSNFGAYLNIGDFQIISSSPERFIKVEDNVVQTIPMKGTRPRHNNRLQDLAFRNDLMASAKDKAELLMIVDLLRNDLGRVCDYGSVKVEKKRTLEKYKTVYQTTATIKGQLHKNKDVIDLIMAAHPGGSVTGCPKIRSIEIIDSLEPTRRSIYTGSLGYLSFCGNIDLNILIRTILKKEDKVYFQVGGGIVADSNPELEYQETLTKAKAMMEALNLCK